MERDVNTLAAHLICHKYKDTIDRIPTDWIREVLILYRDWRITRSGVYKLLDYKLEELEGRLSEEKNYQRL